MSLASSSRESGGGPGGSSGSGGARGREPRLRCGGRTGGVSERMRAQRRATDLPCPNHRLMDDAATARGADVMLGTAGRTAACNAKRRAARNMLRVLRKVTTRAVASHHESTSLSSQLRGLRVCPTNNLPLVFSNLRCFLLSRLACSVVLPLLRAVRAPTSRLRRAQRYRAGHPHLARVRPAHLATRSARLVRADIRVL
jgi:hypothetical protein